MYEAPQLQSVQDKYRPTAELVTPTQVGEETHLRRSSRVSKAPDRLDL